ncbi:MAG TPA: LytTR family DNA-binding domain-containing protein [Flavobacteriales bacterium]|nr:LytTR family DNA-binding domain-containing protein [Flavobacteriales bacterium]
MATNLKRTGAASKITLNVRRERLKLDTSQVVRCQSDNNYTWLFLANGEKKFVSRTLKAFENVLSKSGFFRVHQSHLINCTYIKQYMRESGCFIMADGSVVPVSQRKKSMVNKITKAINCQ